jgi:flagellar biosynthesis/type III secretory pathway protein FliH
MTTTTKPPRAKRRSFKEVEAAAHAKGLNEGYAKAAQQYEHVQEQLMAQIKTLQARLDESIWSRITGLFKGEKT